MPESTIKRVQEWSVAETGIGGIQKLLTVLSVNWINRIIRMKLGTVADYSLLLKAARAGINNVRIGVSWTSIFKVFFITHSQSGDSDDHCDTLILIQLWVINQCLQLA